ncbi:hypothetical protein PC116_g14736 [Phytophthora cactorum]|uniref:DUF7769 domain-containing protein n=1 Tax=Phytophthora cactorum TaxID=29920 RepID=A0A8T1KPY6_9STRA|nr:hypothetical protein Pcac1_g23981 [Phytophthora cactorum]KAG2806143.1 hypothetical protein PC112_g17966 [Phytophthora cactorum]KAG2911703.1 hypothetical protein PC117_g19082 [Phytophthora cactorum]KAG3021889.1 hypothetical protein PC120_g8457 [Phytophthora cactorum]KAG3140756.1 hypothetical protein C6341_g19936 [Phytophthora cactorum]
MDAATTTRRTKNLTREESQLVVTNLLKTSENGKLKRGTIAAVAAECRVTASTVSRVWKRAKTEAARTGSYVAFSRKYLSGRR